MDMDVTFDSLLTKADAAARSGNWQETLRMLTQASWLEPDHPGALSGLGTCLLQLGRPAEAIPYFEKVTSMATDSADARCNLGVAFMIAGDLLAAQQSFESSLEMESEHLPSWKNLAWVHLKAGRIQEGVQILAAIVQAHPADVEALMLLGECYEQGGEIESARNLYEQAQSVAPFDEEIKQALARLEPVAEDPSRLAGPEHLGNLASLGSISDDPRRGRIAFVGGGRPSDENRLLLPAKALAEAGWKTQVVDGTAGVDLSAYAAAVFSRPYTSAGMLSALRACVRRGTPFIVDLDEDVFEMSADHPDHDLHGPGNPEQMQALELSLSHASAITVASDVLAQRLQRFNCPVEVLAPSWDPSNPLWSRPVAQRKLVHLGWFGDVTDLSALQGLRDVLIRLIRKSPHILLVLGGVPQAFDIFKALPDDRKMFLPLMSWSDFPFLLGHFDVLLIPHEMNAYNEARSDQRLLEAGARGLPWIATDLHAYRAWGKGGILVDSAGGWRNALEEMLADPGRRKALGMEGRQAAEARSVEAMKNTWESAFERIGVAR